MQVCRVHINYEMTVCKIAGSVSVSLALPTGNMLSGEIDVYKQRAGDLQHYTSADIALFPGSHAWAENLGMRLVQILSTGC